MMEIAMDDSRSLENFTTALALLERLSGGFETTPLRLSAFVESFCETLCETEPQWVPVITLPGAEPGRSARNVAAKIVRSRGTARYGWAIWENPGISVSASFHAVWVSPKGEFYDVTPEPHEVRRILFLSDPRCGPEFDATTAPASRVKWLHPLLEARLRRPQALEAALRGLLGQSAGDER
jgi:hypothetical protein